MTKLALSPSSPWRSAAAISGVAAAALLLAGCGASTSTAAPTPAQSSPSQPAPPSTAPVPSATIAPENAGDHGEEAAGGVRIPIGESRLIPAIADAVIDIKVVARSTKQAETDLRCTATDATGKQLPLRPGPANEKPETAAGGAEWLTFRTFTPTAGATRVECTSAGAGFGDADFVRAVPRGVTP
ncbi:MULTISPECIES: hypothetical protein [Tsukamurella]|uniref:Uncharacterized protein n=2 Tax=Tsukamurella TaxID=2060 RepID=A0A5C5RVW2_9ACTN|nr:MULTISPECIES: hypothetical protein [Tsukamurella]NMD58527.1 hypothetical protein [Tsukamurella columbiensis]TWS26812.1 hypothetical protein FK530_21865 [Tsukamurella conjunctivitidis]